MIKRSLKHGAQTLRIASRALGRNKMRSFLTALGIMVGVGAVIAMVSIGEGAKETRPRKMHSLRPVCQGL